MSQLEEELNIQIKAVGLPSPIREYRFCPPRRWRGDFVWVGEGLIVEVEGGIWTNGRHTRGSGFEKDCEKYNEATLIGFQVLRVTGSHIKSGKAIQWIERFLNNVPRETLE